MTKKLKDAHGLTMVEMLCAVLILVLLCLLVNTGMLMAVQSYRDVTVKAEAQLLLNSLSNTLCDKLRYAVVTRHGTEGSYTYSKSIDGITVDADGMIYVTGKLLLPKGAYGNGKYKVALAEPISLAVNGDIATFEIDLKIEDTSGNVLAGPLKKNDDGTPSPLTVRCLTPIRKE